MLFGETPIQGARLAVDGIRPSWWKDRSIGARGIGRGGLVGGGTIGIGAAFHHQFSKHGTHRLGGAGAGGERAHCSFLPVELLWCDNLFAKEILLNLLSLLSVATLSCGRDMIIRSCRGERISRITALGNGQLRGRLELLLVASTDLALSSHLACEGLKHSAAGCGRDWLMVWFCIPAFNVSYHIIVHGRQFCVAETQNLHLVQDTISLLHIGLDLTLETFLLFLQCFDLHLVGLLHEIMAGAHTWVGGRSGCCGFQLVHAVVCQRLALCPT